MSETIRLIGQRGCHTQETSVRRYKMYLAITLLAHSCRLPSTNRMRRWRNFQSWRESFGPKIIHEHSSTEWSIHNQLTEQSPNWASEIRCHQNHELRTDRTDSFGEMDLVSETPRIQLPIYSRNSLLRHPSGLAPSVVTRIRARIEVSL